jgi:iron-sulfur cluster repair protein YtfE (RIC family)
MILLLWPLAMRGARRVPLGEAQSMTTQRMTQEDIELTRREHAEICELVTTLYRVLAERHEPGPRVVHLMERLLERIEAHFHDEEALGFFDDLDSRHPQGAEIVERLRGEHLQMLTSLRRLCQQAASDNPTPAWWNELEDGFRDFGTHLCHHEARENDLLQAAFEDDLGNQD